jgi:hypothetical protein
MATVVQQPTTRELWNDYLAVHPKTRMLISALGDLINFIIQGHFVIVIGRWAVMTGGRIAETAMLLSVLWITADRVAPEFVIYVPLHNQITATCIIALSLLPEIILFHAIILCFDHWKEALWNGENKVNGFHFVFALLYTIPTLMFIGMTVWTLVLTATTGTVITADGLLLSARYLAGWFYSLVEMIYPLIARRYNMTVTPSALLVDEKSAQEIEQLTQRIEQLQEQILQLQQVPVEQSEKEAEEGAEVNTEPEPELTLSPKITQPLSYQEIDTGEVETVNKKVTVSRPRKAPSKSAKVINLLKRNPNLKNTEVAKKVNVSAAYVSQIRSQLSLSA